MKFGPTLRYRLYCGENLSMHLIFFISSQSLWHPGIQNALFKVLSKDSFLMHLEDKHFGVTGAQLIIASWKVYNSKMSNQ